MSLCVHHSILYIYIFIYIYIYVCVCVCVCVCVWLSELTFIGIIYYTFLFVFDKLTFVKQWITYWKLFSVELDKNIDLVDIYINYLLMLYSYIYIYIYTCVCVCVCVCVFINLSAWLACDTRKSNTRYWPLYKLIQNLKNIRLTNLHLWVWVSLVIPLISPWATYILWRKQQSGNIHVIKYEINNSKIITIFLVDISIMKYMCVFRCVCVCVCVWLCLCACVCV